MNNVNYLGCGFVFIDLNYKCDLSVLVVLLCPPTLMQGVHCCSALDSSVTRCCVTGTNFTPRFDPELATALLYWWCFQCVSRSCSCNVKCVLCVYLYRVPSKSAENSEMDVLVKVYLGP